MTIESTLIGSTLAQGGWVVGVQYLLSLAAGGIVIDRLWRLHLARRGEDSLWSALHAAAAGAAPSAEATRRAREGTSLLARFLSSFLSERDHPERRERAGHRAESELADLARGVRGLAILANVATLLGLLGTVLGMVDAFRVVEANPTRVDPSALAGGIWVALLTTVVGLTIAIPCLGAHHLLRGRIEALGRRMREAIFLTEEIESRSAAAPSLAPSSTGHAR